MACVNCETHARIAQLPIIVQKVDYTLSSRGENSYWYEVFDEWFHLKPEAFTGQFALMYNWELTSGFDFHQIERLYQPSHVPHFDYFAARIDDNWGLINLYGDHVIPFVFSRFVLVDKYTAFAMYNGSYGILDINQSKTNVILVLPNTENHTIIIEWANETILIAENF